MNMTAILSAGAVVGLAGLLIAVILVIAGRLFYVETDERQAAVRELLPGANCGGCGYAGCDACAEAIAKGEAPETACPVGGPALAKQISQVMGKDPSLSGARELVAFVKCSGTCEKTVRKYEYAGIRECNALTVVPGAGEKGCEYGCMGYGSCVRACRFDAIHIADGIAKVTEARCTGCSACAKACPRNLIAMIPKGSPYRVRCASHKRGKDVKAVCAAGCIGCTLCTKQCAFDTIRMDNNVAVIDYEACTGCGKCAEKCPVKVITLLGA